MDRKDYSHVRPRRDVREEGLLVLEAEQPREPLVMLPQVLGAVAPSLANSAIALFKDTSLVTIVSLYELTGSLGLALSGDAQWRPFYLEAWLFLAAIYWLGCALLARISSATPLRP